MQSLKWRVHILALALAMLSGASSAAIEPVTEPSREEVVAQRAQAYWDAMVARDFKTTYALHSSGYRNKYSYEAHILRSPSWVNFLAARVLEVRCEAEESCAVKVEVSYQAQGIRGAPRWAVNSIQEERWVYMDGEWGRVAATP